MKIFQNNKTTTEETESIVSDQLSQLNEIEQNFLGLMKKADTTNRPIEELLALKWLQYIFKEDFAHRFIPWEVESYILLSFILNSTPHTKRYAVPFNMYIILKYDYKILYLSVVFIIKYRGGTEHE